MEEIKKKAREMFDEKFKELNGKTEIWKGNRPPSHTDIKSFIDKIIDLTVSKERSRIVEKITKEWIPTKWEGYGGNIVKGMTLDDHKRNFSKEIINLINTK